MSSEINKSLIILIVEDDLYSSKLLKEFLKKDCITIHHVTNGIEAVGFCKKNNVDLVLMDIKLPLMNGDDAMLEIKKQKPQLPIIAQTAYAMSNEIEEIVEKGFDGYILKPYKKKELLDQLHIS